VLSAVSTGASDRPQAANGRRMHKAISNRRNMTNLQEEFESAAAGRRPDG